VTIKAALFISLGILTVFYLLYWFLLARRAHQPGRANRPNLFQLALGFVTCFFDALGIGSFAPTTSVFKLRHMMSDERIPGTLNVGHALPTMIQSFVYVAIVEVESVTLVLMIGASVLGAWLGAGIVASWPRINVQVGMGLALLVAAVLFTMTNLGLFPAGGDTLDLGGIRLALGLVGNFLLGALMTLGIGLYAPCMVLVSLLGMNPMTAFPIMMGSCAFLMPVGSFRFIAKGSYSLRPAVGLTVGGIPGVLLAAYVVQSLPLNALRWLVVVLVIYVALAMLRSAVRDPRSPRAGKGNS
jgi:uncharacterized membrane protein YfcA